MSNHNETEKKIMNKQTLVLVIAMSVLALGILGIMFAQSKFVYNPASVTSGEQEENIDLSKKFLEEQCVYSAQYMNDKKAWLRCCMSAKGKEEEIEQCKKKDRKL